VTIGPLDDLPSEPVIAALPKADLHVHQEWGPRLDRVLARREGRASYDWHAWTARLMRDVSPGAPRLAHLAPFAFMSPELDAVPENFIARVADLLEEAAADGAVPTYEAHPIREFVARGIPVVLGTDDPVQIHTTIGREYAVAHALGFSPRELLGFTSNAIRAAFTTEQRRAELLHEVGAPGRIDWRHWKHETRL
jgi:hypothetical protein